MSPPRTRTLRPVRAARDRTFLQYYDPCGTERLIPASQAATVTFEDALPARAIPSHVGQHHTPGHYWSATTDRMIDYESYLESKWMKLLDFDPEVVSFSAQPFTIDSHDSEGAWRHTPDLFARRRDGSVLLLDVKEDGRMTVPAVIWQARRTAGLCQRIGWDYTMVGEPDALRWANVSWLAGYRRPLLAGKALVDRLLMLAQRSVPIGDLVSFQPVPELARSVTYHLMWHHQLAFDETRPLRDHTHVRAADPRSAA
ncbi:TnsA-like heteromeric transposase endonuclease subunit [Streptomyces sp. NPDC001634]|uniref:TnsA-like heteromeric transposase endonuclease subunit n=1 Tax=Streptomyces sp. NPDC001634 TaxID=3154390 RepID=UPI0033169846